MELVEFAIQQCKAALGHTSGFAGRHEDRMASHVVYQFYRMSSYDGVEMKMSSAMTVSSLRVC